MIKIIIFLVILNSSLLSTFLELDQTRFESINSMFGKKAVKRVKFIQSEIKKIKLEEYTYTKIYMVNTLINKLLYKKDKVHWQHDRSSTFLEFITSGAGDSLDFAAAKYVTLIGLGFDQSRFSFFTTDKKGISKDKFDTKNYFVLAYTPKNSKEYVVLDCYTDKIIPSFKDGVNYKLTKIGSKEKKLMIEDMLKINFVQNHQFLNVTRNKL